MLTKIFAMFPTPLLHFFALLFFFLLAFPLFAETQKPKNTKQEFSDLFVSIQTKKMTPELVENSIESYFVKSDWSNLQSFAFIALDQDFSNFKLHYYLGVASFYLMDYELAIEHLSKAQDKQPSNLEVKNYLYKSYRAADKYVLEGFYYGKRSKREQARNSHFFDFIRLVGYQGIFSSYPNVSRFEGYSGTQSHRIFSHARLLSFLSVYASYTNSGYATATETYNSIGTYLRPELYLGWNFSAFFALLNQNANAAEENQSKVNLATSVQEYGLRYNGPVVGLVYSSSTSDHIQDHIISQKNLEVSLYWKGVTLGLEYTNFEKTTDTGGLESNTPSTILEKGSFQRIKAKTKLGKCCHLEAALFSNPSQLVYYNYNFSEDIYSDFNPISQSANFALEYQNLENLTFKGNLEIQNKKDVLENFVYNQNVYSFALSYDM